MIPAITELTSLLALSAIFKFAPAASPTYRSSAQHIQPRQETSPSDPTATTGTDLFPTITNTPSQSSAGPTGAPDPSLSTESHEFIITTTLTPAEKPIPLSGAVGLIMPNPYEKAYVEVQYSLGFVEVVPRPKPTLGGWMRVVTPLLILPDYQVNVFSDSGTMDPTSESAIPPASDGLCGSTMEDFPISYPYIFHRSGWYMFVINQTWIQPTISNNTCSLPLISQKSFFATQSIFISSLPTGGAIPLPPPSTHTHWAELSASMPGSLPIEDHQCSGAEKLGIGLGVAGGILAFGCCVVGLLWLKAQKKSKREIRAFNRLKPADQAQFLFDNPDHFLNPNRVRGRGGMGFTEYGRPRGHAGWNHWGRWGQRSGVTGMQGWGAHGDYESGTPAKGQGQGYGHGYGGGMRQVYNVPQDRMIGLGSGQGSMAGAWQGGQPTMVWPTQGGGSVHVEDT